MKRLHIATRGISSWRERLAKPEGQWKRGFSAFETAVSWENAGKTASGIPGPIANLLVRAGYAEPALIFGIAEHKVDLPGGRAASQCDFWAMVKTAKGMLSLSLEAKARESFGDHALGTWLNSGTSANSASNRRERWDYIRRHLPGSSDYLQVRYQILHRCAVSVVEAKRLGFQHAAFIVQAFRVEAFGAPPETYADYRVFCEALGVEPVPGRMSLTAVDGISLAVGWADCDLATDAEVAEAVS